MARHKNVDASVPSRKLLRYRMQLISILGVIVAVMLVTYGFPNAFHDGMWFFFKKGLCLFISCCRESEAPRDVAIVTAFFDLGRGDWPYNYSRSNEEYFTFAKPVLRLNVPMVIYTEKRFSQKIWEERWSRQDITRVISTSLEHMDYYRYLGQIQKIKASPGYLREFPEQDHPESFSTEYIILTNSKVSFLHEAAEKWYFNATAYYWLDFGYGLGENESTVFPASCTWAPRNVMTSSTRDKIAAVQLFNSSAMRNVKSVDVLYTKKLEDPVAGGFFGGSRSAIRRYAACHRDVFENVLLARNRVDDEQVTMMGCWLRNKKLFNFVHGNWFDAFKLFH